MRRSKSEVLNNIETLFREALGREALASEQAGLESDERTVDREVEALAELVEKATAAAAQRVSQQAARGAAAQPFERVKEQMDHVSRLKPPQEDTSKVDAEGYDFKQVFAHLVRQSIREYIDSEVEAVIRQTIRTELDAYFKASLSRSADAEHRDAEHPDAGRADAERADESIG